MKSYFILTISSLLSGLLISHFVPPAELLASPYFSTFTYILLGLGLYGAVYGIDLQSLKILKKQVFLVVTVGVLIKILFIGSILFFITGNIFSYLLACIVAQIDPLSIAKLTEKTTLSPKAQTMLKAWASFDDPMTVLIAFYFILPFLISSQSSFLEYLLNVGYNIAFAAFAFVLNKYLTKLTKNRFTLLLLLAFLAIGITFKLMFGLALVALILRPQITLFDLKFDDIVNKIVTSSYYISVVILGILVSSGVYLQLGIILGILAFVSQILVTNGLLFNFSKGDKIKLSFAQYNGITSIILASFLQQYFTQTVGIVAVALVAISVLYFGVNAFISKNEFDKIH